MMMSSFNNMLQENVTRPWRRQTVQKPHFKTADSDVVSSSFVLLTRPSVMARGVTSPADTEQVGRTG